MKLEGTQKEALIRLACFFEQRGIPFAVIGALAPVLMIDSQRKEEDGYGCRITKDVDVSIRANGWREYEALKADLILSGFSEKPGFPEHCLFYDGVQVDLIPCGDALIRNGILEWPRSGFRMNVRGFERIFQNTQTVQIEEGISVPVIPVPLSIFLKIITWLDRHESRDLEDILYMLDQYETVEVSERRFETPDSEALNYDNRGAFLAGSDLKKLGIEGLAEIVKPFFEAFIDEDTPILFSVSRRVAKGTIEMVRLIQTFKLGLGISE